jgi:hypothetical protein
MAQAIFSAPCRAALMRPGVQECAQSAGGGNAASAPGSARQRGIVALLFGQVQANSCLASDADRRVASSA